MYRKKVGSICYPAVITRPDIAKAASKLSEFLTNPGPDHLKAADHCLRYLYGTRHLGTRYSAKTSIGDRLTEYAGPTPNHQVFQITSDASYANFTDRKSGEGYTFRLFGGPIDWTSRKQATLTTSTTEVELLSLLHAGKELLWWKRLFGKLRFEVGHDLTMLVDNRQTIRLLTSEIPRLETKLRHIDIAQCWLRQEVQNGHIDVAYLPTARMTLDGLTKLLPAQKHQVFVQHLGMVNLEGIVMKLKMRGLVGSA